MCGREIRRLESSGVDSGFILAGAQRLDWKRR